MTYENGLVFVDCEAAGTSPVNGVMTEFGMVHLASDRDLKVVMFESTPHPDNPAIPVPGKRVTTDEDAADKVINWLDSVVSKDKPVFVSDNPGYDWQWISALFAFAFQENPFGYSSRRIGDYYAGLMGNWQMSSQWKRLRKTKHTHDPVDDARGNAEAWRALQNGAR